MMRSLAATLLLLLLSASCTKDVPAVVDAGVTRAPLVVVDSGAAPPFALSAERLQQFIEYRAKLHETLAAFHPEKRKSVTAREHARTMVAQAIGLDPTEALRVESMVFQVMAQRSLAKNGQYAKSLDQLRGNLDRMHPDQRIDAIKDLEELEAMLEEMSTANALRSTFGDKNVDLILSRSDELMPVYEQALSDERGSIDARGTADADAPIKGQ